MNFSKIFIYSLVFAFFLHVCNADPRCYRLDMSPTTVQFCEKMNDNFKETTLADLLKYELEKIKIYLDKNQVRTFENEILIEIANTLDRYFNHNDRNWYDCYEIIFWLFQIYKCKVFFTEADKKIIEDHLEPFKKDLLRFHPKSISDEEIENAMQGMFFVKRTQTLSIETPQPSLWEHIFSFFF